MIARNILPSCCNSLNEKEQDAHTDLATYPDNKEESVFADPQIKQIGNLVERENYANPQVGRVYAGNGVAPTLSTMQGGDRQPKVVVKSNICIDDTQGFEDKPRVYNNTAPSLRSQKSGLKINSNTQCYKQAGNSIVVDVMVEMFKNLHINNVKK